MHRFWFFISLVVANQVTAAECDELFVIRATPDFPTSMNALAAIQRGPCSVDVIFNLSDDGKPTVLSAIASDKRCSVFERSANRSIQQSEFKLGTRVESCRIQVSYDLEGSS